MIAAYFADVDTTNPGSAQVTYGWSDTQFCANWVGVGYYNSQVDICPVGGGTCTSTTASPAGIYSTIGLAVGDYDITVTPPAGSELLPATQSTTITAGVTTTLDFQLLHAHAGAIDISVIDVDLSLIPGATVEICNIESGDCLPALLLTDDSAPLTVSGVLAGEYEIRVTAPAATRSRPTQKALSVGPSPPAHMR